MKKYFFVTVIACCLSGLLYAQGITFGLKAGATLNKISGKAFNEQFTFGYHLGGFVTLNLGKKWGIQPEVFFNQVNQDTASNFSSVYQFNNISKVKLNYLSIPIMLNYRVSNILDLQAGPQFSILLDQNVSLVQNGKNAFKTGDLALAGGLQLKLLKFRAYGRYAIGLSNVSDIGNSDKWKNQSIQLGLGIAL